ncbi:MAG TPA: tetratricopeptide repeat protein, partial [Micromonosporaceae bacterium]|nr:tetratricopeptide repeat protein [Micromonosporaceae bacterium]
MVTDWQRIGMPGRLDGRLLFDLYGRCWRRLTGARPAAPVSRDRFRDARRWASQPTPTRPWLIDEVAGSHIRPHPLLGVLADDPEHGWATTEAIWNHAAKALTGADRIRLALGAYDRDDYRHTRILLASIDPTNLPPGDLATLVTVFHTIAAHLYTAGHITAARRWFTRAVDTGHPDQAPAAMVNLGNLEAGQGDPDEARRWYGRAAGTCHSYTAPVAMVNLGNLEEEQGNIVEARRWFTRAASTSHPELAPKAILNLGFLEREQGNIVEARRWFTGAVDTAYPDAAPRAMVNLGNLE